MRQGALELSGKFLSAHLIPIGRWTMRPDTGVPLENDSFFFEFPHILRHGEAQKFGEHIVVVKPKGPGTPFNFSRRLTEARGIALLHHIAIERVIVSLYGAALPEMLAVVHILCGKNARCCKAKPVAKLFDLFDRLWARPCFDSLKDDAGIFVL